MYEDRHVRRGEIYRVRLDTGWDSEQGATRPALIISSNIGNDTSPVVIVAYMTTREHDIGVHYGPTKATGIPSYVCCEQLATVSKKRIIGNVMGSLTPNEMKEVENRLDEVLDLGYVDDTALKAKDTEISARDVHISELKREVAGIKAEIGKKDEEIASLKMEIEMWQKCYGRCMDMLVDTKVNGDFARRVAAPVEQSKNAEPTKQLDPPAEPSKPEEPELVDINSASFDKLRAVGMSNNVVLAVINGRPHNSVEDLKNVPGVNSKMYNVIEKKLCCVPVKVEKPIKDVDPGYEKVNVNTASAKEIHDVLGLSMTTCYSITGYRKKHGPYEKLEDLLNVANVFQATLNRLGHLMEV